jgi:hypothetical protein
MRSATARRDAPDGAAGRRAEIALVANDLAACGEVLHESWMVKRSMASGVSTRADRRVVRAGAGQRRLGGKISGAGGGGFLMLFAPRHAHAAICRACRSCAPSRSCSNPRAARSSTSRRAPVIELTDTVRDAFARGYLEEVSSSVAKLPLAQIAAFADRRARLSRRPPGVRDRQRRQRSTASHMACDLAKNIYPAGRWPASAASACCRSPTTSGSSPRWPTTAATTACSPSSSPSTCVPGDLVIAISASGNSPNILEALVAARAAGARTAALLGFDGGRARDLADVAGGRGLARLRPRRRRAPGRESSVTAWMRRVVADVHRD